MSALPSTIKNDTFHPLYEQFMLHTKCDKNDRYFAIILSSWIKKKGVLPQCIGLSIQDFRELMGAHFPGLQISERVRENEVFDLKRMPERDDLVRLFDSSRANSGRSEIWVSQLITAACLGSNHLWQDLGLWNRNQLSELIAINFPALARKNTKNMKWKKFLYKQLCIEEGIYICRSPSCEVCIDYVDCFGPEE